MQEGKDYVIIHLPTQDEYELVACSKDGRFSIWKDSLWDESIVFWADDQAAAPSYQFDSYGKKVFISQKSEERIIHLIQEDLDDNRKLKKLYFSQNMQIINDEQYVILAYEFRSISNSVQHPENGMIIIYHDYGFSIPEKSFSYDFVDLIWSMDMRIIDITFDKYNTSLFYVVFYNDQEIMVTQMRENSFAKSYQLQSSVTFESPFWINWSFQVKIVQYSNQIISIIVFDDFLKPIVRFFKKNLQELQKDPLQDYSNFLFFSGQDHKFGYFLGPPLDNISFSSSQRTLKQVPFSVNLTHIQFHFDQEKELNIYFEQESNLARAELDEQMYFYQYDKLNNNLQIYNEQLNKVQEPFFSEVTGIATNNPDHLTIFKVYEEEQVDNNTGMIIGIVIGSVFFVALLVFLIIFCYKKLHSENDRKEDLVQPQISAEELMKMEKFKIEGVKTVIETECAICLDYKCDSFLPCLHIFHEKCIRAWIKKDRSCPVCRQTSTLKMIQSMQAQL